MADEGNTSFKLDLDIKDFTDAGLRAQGIIEKIGDSGNLTGLLEGLVQTGALLGSVGIAAFAFKETLDLVGQGEEIQRITTQFEELSKQAGIAPEKLKQGLEKSARGLIDTTDLLKIANESLVKLGSGADRLPEIMDLALKATQVYGGDAKSNFENISNAIANGNVRMLKHYGITIDLVKAQKDFAAANGITANELSATGKQQAVLNAALEQGAERFKNIQIDLNTTKNLFQEIKVTFTEVGETIALVVERTVGPALRSVLSWVRDVAHSFKTFISGSDLEKTESQISDFQNRIKELNSQISKLQNHEGIINKIMPQSSIDKQIQNLTNEVKQYESALEKLEEKKKTLQKPTEQPEVKKESDEERKNKLVNQEQMKQDYLKFNQELQKINQQTYQFEVKNVNSLAQIDRVMEQQKLQMEKHQQLNLTQIKNSEHLNEKQKTALMLAENKRYHQQLKANESATAQFRIQLLKNYQENSETIFEGIGRAAQTTAAQAASDLKDFGKTGQEVMSSFQMHSQMAFEAMGEAIMKGQNVAESAAKAMRNIFLNVIADRAIQTGTLMILEAVWPPNPVEFAAGAGLIALGGALRSMASDSSGMVGSVSTGSIASGGESSAQATSTFSNSGQAVAVAPSSDQSQKVVNINIAGNYLETDQTRRMLIDLTRQESDATGFNYNHIGA